MTHVGSEVLRINVDNKYMYMIPHAVSSNMFYELAYNELKTSHKASSCEIQALYHDNQTNTRTNKRW